MPLKETSLNLVIGGRAAGGQADRASHLIGEAYDLARKPMPDDGVVKVVIEYDDRIPMDAPEPLIMPNEGVCVVELPWDGVLPKEHEQYGFRPWCLDMLHSGFTRYLRLRGRSTAGADEAYAAVVNSEYQCRWEGPIKRDVRRGRYARAIVERSEEETLTWVEVSETKDFVECRRFPIVSKKASPLVCDARKRVGVLRWTEDGRLQVSAKPQRRFDPFPDLFITV
jgi:hypothetical protein